jgi:hypothetical protein
VIPLRGPILRVSQSDAEDLLHNRPVLKRSGTHCGPVLPLAPADQVVEGGERVPLMIQMPMQQGQPLSIAIRAMQTLKTYHKMLGAFALSMSFFDLQSRCPDSGTRLAPSGLHLLFILCHQEFNRSESPLDMQPNGCILYLQ